MALSGALAPLVCPFLGRKVRHVGRRISVDLERDLRLEIGEVFHRDELMRAAIAPLNYASVKVSRSVAAGRCGVVASRAGKVGLDMETVTRVALNATSQDRWLATAERALVEMAPDQAAELACHWVLKEAYGKALGVGLALPLDRLAFVSLGEAVTLEGSAAPAGQAGWSFCLYRHADMLLAIAYQPDFQTGMPLAPAGRNPPMPRSDR